MAERLTIQGVGVHFPFKPYPAQIQTMSGVIAALKKVRVCVSCRVCAGQGGL